MSFQNSGTSFHSARGGRNRGADDFAIMVARVLREAVGGHPSAVKRVAGWTGAGERTVKNWFAGRCAPRGEHFRELVRHCPEMLDAFLVSAGRSDRLAIAKMRLAESALREALAILSQCSS